VLEWAERLVRDGIDVTIDKWSLKEGQDKYAFMESMVTDSTVTKVIVLSDATYANKADAKKGGVGTESQIISGEVYAKVEQTKFIPVVCERDEASQPCLPTFLKSRIYIDFSSPQAFHDEYQKLVRAIYNKTLYKKPELGVTPEYILNPSRPSSDIEINSVAELRKYILSNPSDCSGYITHYFDAVYERLEQYRLALPPQSELDELILESLDALLGLRNALLDAFSLCIIDSRDPNTTGLIINFCERMLWYKGHPEGATHWSHEYAENYSIFLYDVYLHLVAMLLNRGRLTDCQQLLEHNYLLPDNFPNKDNDHPLANFTMFWAGSSALSRRNNRLQLQRIDLIADLLKERTTTKHVSFRDLMQAEGVLFMRSVFANATTNIRKRAWFPHSFVYAQYSMVFPLFARATSRKTYMAMLPLVSAPVEGSPREVFLDKIRNDNDYAGWFGSLYTCDVNFDTMYNLKGISTID